MIKFRKMHGLGNDFVIVDTRTVPLTITPGDARLLCDRRLGVGCDQLIVLSGTPGRPHVHMAVWNPDGSRSGACGNATRCVADIVMQETGAAAVTVETAFGALPATRAADGAVTVAMGVPLFEWDSIPLSAPLDAATLSQDIAIHHGLTVHGLGVANMGNPHLALFVADADAVPVERIGPALEHDARFPERANIEFCSIIDAGAIRLRVWERGAGVTPACGSGTCAAVAIGARLGLLDRKVAVTLDGGTLLIEWGDDDNVRMTGPVSYVFDGTFGA